MKKKLSSSHFKVLAILLFISLVTIFPYVLNNYIYWQDDLLFHRTRLESYVEAVQHLEFFPKIFPAMGNHYGYAADLFYPSILLLPFAVFRITGLDFVAAFYLYQFLISFATAVIAYQTIKSITGSNDQGLLFTSIYTLSTYRLMDQSVRGALGETLAFAFLPLVIAGVFQIFYQEKNSWLLLSAGMSLLIASHLITAFYTAFFILIFMLISGPLISKSKLICFGKTIIASLLLSAWFILPYLEQVTAITFSFSKVKLWGTGLDFTLGNLFLNSLSNIGRVADGLKPNFGIFLLVILLYALLNFKNLTESCKKLTILTVIFVILSTNLFFWGLFKETFLAVIQFQWRLLIFVTFFASLLAAKLIANYKIYSKKYTLLLVIWLLTFLAYGFNSTDFAASQNKNRYAVTNENYLDFDQSEMGHGKEYLIAGISPAAYFDFPYPNINGAYQTEFKEETLHLIKKVIISSNYLIKVKLVCRNSII